MTYIIPAGQFAKETDAAGNPVINMGTFEFIARTPVSFLNIPVEITKAFSKSIGIIVLIAAGSGAFEVIRKTGTIDAIIGLTLEKTRGNGKKAMWIVSLIFTLLSCAVIPHVFIPFTPMCIALAMALGYDDFTGTCLILCFVNKNSSESEGKIPIFRLGIPHYPKETCRFQFLGSAQTCPSSGRQESSMSCFRQTG